jgi:hypothetical protein
MVFFSGENGGYSMCGMIQRRVWIVCSSGEYGWSAPVESREGLLQWRVRMVCSSGSWPAPVELWMSAFVEIIDGCFWQTYRSVSRSPDSSSS